MRWLPEDSGVVLRPNPSFQTQVLLPQFINQSISLAAFQSGSQSDQLRDHLLCLVRALRCYVAATTHLRKTDQLFVCYGAARRGTAVSKQRLSNWVVDVITMAYKKAQKPLPGSVSCHSTRSVSTSWAAFRGVSMADICAAATWASPCTFARFYKLNIATLHTVSSAVLREQS